MTPTSRARAGATPAAFLRWRRLLTSVAAGLALTSMVAAPAHASRSWDGYHWARTANPFTLTLGDNVSGSWDSYLAGTSSDWSVSTVLDTSIGTGRAGPVKRCGATNRRLEVCNTTYGNTGWLGIAQVWASGSHITQGGVKLNDTYFNTASYNTPAWRNQVMCQEVGHTLGLNHQDENFDNPNLGTCMDYTRDPSTNQHPNAHDYEQLATIYGHLDATTTVGTAVAGSAAADWNDPSAWGRAIRTSSDGRSSLHGRSLGGDQKVFTFVIWAR